MAKTMYDVTLRCEDMMAMSVLLGTVAGSAELVGVKQVLDHAMAIDAPHERTPLRAAPRLPALEPAAAPPWKINNGGISPRYHGGKKDKGISGWQLLFQVLGQSQRSYSHTEITRAFEARGFAPRTASPLLYRAIKEHRVRNMGGSMYELVRDGSINGAAL